MTCSLITDSVKTKFVEFAVRDMLICQICNYWLKTLFYV